MFDGIEAILDAYIQELTECLDFISVSARLRPRLRDFIDWRIAEGSEKQLIIRFLAQNTVKEQVVYRVLYLGGHTAFEQFARDLVTKAGDYMSANIGAYNDLWQEMKTEHIYRTGQAMATIYQPLEHYAFDYEQLSRNIGRCISGGGGFTLNSDALALIRGTLTPDNLEKLVGRLSVSLNWDTIASNSAVKACFHLDRTRDLANEVKVFLREMVKNRNRIAHSTGTAGEIGEPELREQLRFVAAFCHALSRFVKTEVTRKVAACSRRAK